MRGDEADFVARLKLTLPGGWFADDAPVVTGLLAGLGAGWVSLFRLLAAVRLEARIATATDRFLDLVCLDFFAGGLMRRSGEADAVLLARLQRAMRRLRGTRTAVIDAAWDAGYAATVFEPARPADTGAYGGSGAPSGGLAWNIAGGWGSLTMPLECLVTVQAIAAVADPAVEIAAAVPAGGVAWLRIGR